MVVVGISRVIYSLPERQALTYFLSFVHIKYFQLLDMFATVGMSTELLKLLRIMDKGFQGRDERNHWY